jgi:deoxycytidylate deaminase
MHHDWSDLAFGSKKSINNLNALFIAAPRELSTARFMQLIKEYLPKGNVVLGLAKEPYVLGLEDQPQFRMLEPATVQSIIDKVNNSASKHKIYTLSYFQRELKYILEKLDFTRIILVNGSWYFGFHLKPEYYVLASRRIDYDMVSPFASEAEARTYADTIKLPKVPGKGLFTDKEMLGIADRAAKHSFDYASFQTAVALGRKKGNKYELLATGHNQVVPFETYAMHYGSARERNFSPPNDLNHYDTIHAEIALLLKLVHKRIDAKGSTLFINLLPCPTCARMFVASDITEFVYREEHSGGYAITMLEAAGKKIRRLV